MPTYKIPETITIGNETITCVASEQRICFGIRWFATEAEADLYAAHVRKEGITYNGGWFHGMMCGRDKTWDHDGMFAVTD